MPKKRRGTGEGNRTLKTKKPTDFKSVMSTYSITPANIKGSPRLLQGILFINCAPYL